MTWGIYWMFYHCPDCGKKFKSGADMITEPTFGRCPVCNAEGVLIGESKEGYPTDAEDYEDTAEY